MHKIWVVALLALWLTACGQSVQSTGNAGATQSARPTMPGETAEALTTASAATPTAAATPTLSATDRNGLHHCETVGADYATGWYADELIAVSVLADGQALCQYTGEDVGIPKGPPHAMEGDTIPEPYDLIGITVSAGGIANLKFAGWAANGPYEPPGSRRLR